MRSSGAEPAAMADNVADNLDKLSLGDQKDVRIPLYFGL